MSSESRFSTAELPADETARAWRDWMACLFNGLESDLYGDTVFDGEVQTARAGDVVLTRLAGNRHRVIRTTRMSRHGDPAYLKIVAPWQGSAAVEQYGRQAFVRPGAWAIYDTTGSYEVGNPVRTEHLIVMLPKEQLIERGLKLDLLMGRTVGGASGISRVALENMRNTYKELPQMSEAARRGAGELIVELVRLSLQELAGQECATTQLEAFRDRIRSYISMHLRDPALSIDDIAVALNCSKRHLYNAFSAEDDTLARYILRRRLQACMRDLKNPDQLHRTITEIAFSWGFSSGAYFSRAFREHAGVAPSEFREAALRRGER